MIIEQPAIYLRWLYPKAYWRMDRHEKGEQRDTELEAILKLYQAKGGRLNDY